MPDISEDPFALRPVPSDDIESKTKKPKAESCWLGVFCCRYARTKKGTV